MSNHPSPNDRFYPNGFVTAEAGAQAEEETVAGETEETVAFTSEGMVTEETLVAEAAPTFPSPPPTPPVRDWTQYPAQPSQANATPQGAPDPYTPQPSFAGQANPGGPGSQTYPGQPLPGGDQEFPGYPHPGQYQGQAYPQAGFTEFSVQEVPWSPKSKMAAGLFGILLGTFGVHNFYLGFTGKGIAQLLITLLSFGILSFVSAIWGLVEGILVLSAPVGTQWDLDADGRPMRPIMGSGI